MINPIFTCSPSVDDQTLSSTWLPTDEELRRIKEFQEIERRGDAYQQYLRFGSGEEPSIVLDNFLFLGNRVHGSNLNLLERLQIKHIINAGETDISEKLPHDRFDIIYITMDDDIRTNIKQYFDRTNELLHNYHMKNERCLVHCAAGVSRSATIVLAYLMKYHHNTLNDAFHYLLEKRPQIYPNDGFMLQLLRYENELIKSREIVSTEEASKVNNPIETIQEFEKKQENQANNS
ncbi:unnamed protein product [Adineta steineri]|uniref:protein-tyrosine-phosphatase n=1 Tax=Adineta steineri TaxID=433720 RepID=A0A818SE22_9BILA|nr:unnamed protein product [Adineta steineri]CAF3662057.1 unnamed protein product [Adineta steineri]